MILSRFKGIKKHVISKHDFENLISKLDFKEVQEQNYSKL